MQDAKILPLLLLSLVVLLLSNSSSGNGATTIIVREVDVAIDAEKLVGGARDAASVGWRGRAMSTSIESTIAGAFFILLIVTFFQPSFPSTILLLAS